ncbi:MAG: PepSY domain-containing protein [Deltaproteobacteria bacterium]
MRRILKSVCGILTVLVVGMTPDARARAGDEIDIGHEAARELVESGRIRPLDAIVGTVVERVPGKLIETQLEQEHGLYVYEVKILRPDGRVQEVEVDAATGKILKIEDDD